MAIDAVMRLRRRLANQSTLTRMALESGVKGVGAVATKVLGAAR